MGTTHKKPESRGNTMGYEIIPGNIAVTNTRMSSKNTREGTLETEQKLDGTEERRNMHFILGF